MDGAGKERKGNSREREERKGKENGEKERVGKQGR